MLRTILTSPPRLFALISLILVGATMAATGLTLSRFFREAMLSREGAIISDFARTVAARGLVPADIETYQSSEAQAHLARSFGLLEQLSEVVRIKVFSRDGEIVWSDDAGLIGSRAMRGHDVREAFAGRNAVIFYEERMLDDGTGVPAGRLVEVYVPIMVRDPFDGEQVAGVMALYRSAEPLNATLSRGVMLVWLVVALGGGLLFAALFALFRSVHERQRDAESRLSKLSSEHQRIVQMEKLSAIGTMIGQIAHQINSPLVGVVNLAQLAERVADDAPQVRELLRDIAAAGAHCSDFVQRMLNFTRISHFDLQDADLRTIIGETVDLFVQATPGHPCIDIGLSTEPAAARVDPVLVRHALFNLLVNACQARPGGPIVVALSRTPRGWDLSVSDSGPGVPLELRRRIFTPFFTTRPGGTGLGLSVVEHIAALHGGGIEVGDAPGGGARFALWFPAEAAPEEK